MDREEFFIWIKLITDLCQAIHVHYCTGTSDEIKMLVDNMVVDGMLLKLNEKLRPNSYLARSDPSDVARLEKATFICTNTKEDAGPTNNWEDPIIMKDRLNNLLNGSMKNKTLYVIPFVMGPLGDKHSIYGIQITDSPYVVVNMSIMTTMGNNVLDYILANKVTLIKCVHSVGCSNDGSIGTNGQTLSLKWPSNAIKYIAHFPETLEVISYGSGYGGNSILGKKSIALRMASYIGQKECWLAEHMLLIGLTPPADYNGKSKETIYITGAFPSATGKTNLALMNPALPGWKITTYGDDITWMKLGHDGKLYGMNPEAGFFGVAPNTSWDTNPHCMKTIENNTIFTNVALTSDGDVWWEGLSDTVPEGLTDWKGDIYTGNYPAAHPNARFTVSIQNCPIACNQTNDSSPLWVPISAILLGGRRKDVVPLVRESLSWKHGVYMGCTIASETTAAAEGKVGNLRYDPFAMLPFCGYNMGKYFEHWVKIADNDKLCLPKFFYVNWFRRNEDGSFLWPGFSQNIRVLEWIYNRVCDDTYPAKYTPIGYIPETINVEGIEKVDIKTLLAFNVDEWSKQLELDRIYLETFLPNIPRQILDENTRMINEIRST